RDPDSILTHPRLRELVDLGEPVGVLLVSVLAAINDDDLTP
ncbi:SAM-dependent methyltransferase, partial [Microbispora sp. KK1-11]